MNNSTAKLLRKLAKKSDLPYKDFKRYYKDLDVNQRKAFKTEVKEILEN